MNKKEVTTIWVELVFLDKETGEALQRFVLIGPTRSSLDAPTPTSSTKQLDRNLIKDRHAPKQDDQ